MFMRIPFLVASAFCFLFTTAQITNAPFLHGVASGDPLTDRVILWTRVSPADTTQPATVNWRIATDTNFTTLINSGNFTTDASRDFTVKVDADGLQPGTWYYYDFETGGNHSLIGRTKTAPAAGAAQARFAVATCAKYSKGFFNAYSRIGERNDLDAVIHLGDYIYESEDEGDVGRPMEPAARCSTLAMFRTRYSQYHTDLDLVYARQQYPWINVWDDHETGNDCWMHGAEHFPDSTQFAQIKRDATQAFFEWIPIRDDSTRPGSIYRKLQYGNLIDLLMLDTRREGRMQQLEFTDTMIFDANRTILGNAQYDWLIANLDSSAAQWRILGQQVMMAPLSILNVFINSDQWNGYSAERDKLLQHISDSAITNVVVLTGDVHSSFAWDLPVSVQQYDSATHQGSVAVEFITPAIASSDPDFNFPFAPVKSNNPSIQYLDMIHNGYIVLDVTPAKVQSDFYFVETTDYRKSTENFSAAYYTLDGTQYLQKATTSTQQAAALQPQAPLAEGYSPVATGIRSHTTWSGDLKIFPNPASRQVTVQLEANDSGAVHIELLDAALKRVAEKKLLITQTGAYAVSFDVKHFPAGIYSAKITSPSGAEAVKPFVIQK